MLPGLDGRKMSKSYGNTVPLFAPPGQQARLVRRVMTDSRGPQDPKDPESSTLVALLDAFGEPPTAREVRGRYRTGGPATARSKPSSPTSCTRPWRRCASATRRSSPIRPGSTRRSRPGNGTPTARRRDPAPDARRDGPVSGVSGALRETQ